jgi:hypothetical protein
MALHSSSNRLLKLLVLKLVGQVSLNEVFKHLFLRNIFHLFYFLSANLLQNINNTAKRKIYCFFNLMFS